MIGVVADLCWKVEGYREACLALLQQVLVAKIGLFCRSIAGVLPHGPQPSSIHRWVGAAREGILTGEAQVRQVVHGIIVRS